MKAWIKKRLSFLTMIAVATAHFGCVAISPAGPPAPLAELPSSLSFPDSIALDVGETSGGGGSIKFFAEADEPFKPQVLPIGGEFFDAIVFGFNLNEFANSRVEETLANLSKLSIPLNPVTIFFDTADTIPFERMKIDFSDFDYNGDGQNDGCTGCTCPTGCDSVCPTEAAFEDLQPVCYRIWRDTALNGEFVPFMAGRFDQLNIVDNPNTPENDSNPGEGSFRVSTGLFVDPAAPPVGFVNIGAEYNHRFPDRPLDKITEYFPMLQISFFDPDSDVANVRVEQTALDDTNPSEDRLVKTIRDSDNQVNSDGTPVDPPSNFRYIARYRTDFNFWSGTFQNSILLTDSAFVPPPNRPNFTAQCAELSTGVGVDQSSCLDIGIDVTDVPFLDLLLPDDPRVNLPSDFPATPTF